MTSVGTLPCCNIYEINEKDKVFKYTFIKGITNIRPLKFSYPLCMYVIYKKQTIFVLILVNMDC